MKVLLRHAVIGLYYAGRKHWVGNPDSALDLGTIERATELSREEEFGDMDIMVTYEDPSCELVLPLRRSKAAAIESLRVPRKYPVLPESRPHVPTTTVSPGGEIGGSVTTKRWNDSTSRTTSRNRINSTGLTM